MIMSATIIHHITTLRPRPRPREVWPPLPDEIHVFDTGSCVAVYARREDEPHQSLAALADEHRASLDELLGASGVATVLIMKSPTKAGHVAADLLVRVGARAIRCSVQLADERGKLIAPCSDIGAWSLGLLGPLWSARDRGDGATDREIVDAIVAEADRAWRRLAKIRYRHSRSRDR
jgi:hypothetical protein